MQHLRELLYGVVFRFRAKLPQSPTERTHNLTRKDKIVLIVKSKQKVMTSENET